MRGSRNKLKAKGEVLNKDTDSGEFVLYLAVLPKYRTECIRLLKAGLGSRLSILISSAHLDPSVKSGIPSGLYREVHLVRILGKRAFIQMGHFRSAFAAATTVVDLNPRSLTAWLILSGRRILRRRTLVWGHIHPQAGAAAPTARLRLAMRRLSSGTISYTYRDAGKAVKDLPEQKVWVAPNSLYLGESIVPAPSIAPERTDVLYVGRFAHEKKVELLIRGFSTAAAKLGSMRLVLVGGGAQEPPLRELVEELGIAHRVQFPGWIDDEQALRSYYGRAFCSASPGFAGLGLTQSLGFGVPMVVAENEPHSPEIELEASGGVTYFESDSADSLSEKLLTMWAMRGELPSEHLSNYTRSRYSAEAMASGLLSALQDEPTLASPIEVI